MAMMPGPYMRDIEWLFGTTPPTIWFCRAEQGELQQAATIRLAITVYSSPVLSGWALVMP